MKKETNGQMPFFGIPKMLPYIRPHRRAILLMVLLGCAASAVDIAVPLFERYSLNHFVTLGTLDTLGWFALLYTACVAAQSVANYFSCTMATATEVRVNRDLRDAAFNHLQTLSFGYFNQNSVGYIHSRVMSDTSRIGTLFSWTMMEGTWHFAFLIGAVAVMFATNARLALLVTLIVPLIAVIFSLFQRRLVRVNREIREINSRITSDFNEGITGAKTIKLLVA